MASKNSKRMTAVATMAASVVLLGGAAFASPAGHLGNTAGLVPDPVGRPRRRPAAPPPTSSTRSTHPRAPGANPPPTVCPNPSARPSNARSTAGDVLNKIDGLTSAGTTGLAPDPIGQTVESARSTAGDVLNKIDGLTSAGTTGLAPDPIGQTVESARSTAGDVLNQVDRAF